METTEVRPAISLNNLLVATDFSALSQVALKYAAAIASRHQSKVYIAHVMPPIPRSFIPIEPVPPEFDSDRKQAAQDLAKLADSESLTNIPHQELLADGEICGALSELVLEHEIDLLILGTHGRGGIKTILLGSVAEAIFRNITCPVLTVGPAVPMEGRNGGRLRQILFATDFGASSLAALPYAIAMAKDDDAKLILLHVLAVPPALDADARWYSQTDLLEQREPARRTTFEKLKQLIPADANLPVEPQFVASWGILPRGIVNAAEELQADLIVMGANPVHFVRTSTHVPWTIAHEVVRHAKCPVVTVRSAA
jgi:nucleotide-binding universal stress UspA family protein